MTKKLEGVNASVVVTAQEHNPSILHSSFLVGADIVSRDLELAEPPLSTPGFSRVRYKNGVSFEVELGKLSITHGHPARDLAGCEIPAYATKYIETLPHVRYTAVGVNFIGFFAEEKPDEFLIGLLKDGPWNAGELKLLTNGLRFAYSCSPGILKLNSDAGSVRLQGEESSRQGVVVRANYHGDIAGEKRVEEAKKLIGLFDLRWKHFTHTTAILFGLEE